MSALHFNRFAVCLLCLSCVSCEPKSKNTELFKEKQILRQENASYEIYYAGNASNAERALHNYIRYLADYDNDLAMRRVCYSGKALALARLEFIKSNQVPISFNFDQAIDAFQVYDESVPKLSPGQIRHALIAIIAKDDVGRVPWVTEQAVAKAEAIRQP